MDDGKKQVMGLQALGLNRSRFDSKLEPPEMLEAFKQSLERLKDYLLPILGGSTVDAIFRNAVRENRKRYQFLASAIINTAEISFSDIPKEDVQIEPGELLRGMLDFMQSVITLLTELTGDVLTRKVETLMSDMDAILEESKK